MNFGNRSADTRLLEVAQEPPSAPVAATPMPVEEVLDPQEEEEPPVPATAESAVAIGGVPAVSTSGSFHFMQESELEASTPFDGAEWVERSDAAGHSAEQQGGPPAPLDLAEDSKLVNGHTEESLPEVFANIILINSLDYLFVFHHSHL